MYLCIFGGKKGLICSEQIDITLVFVATRKWCKFLTGRRGHCDKVMIFMNGYIQDQCVIILLKFGDD